MMKTFVIFLLSLLPLTSQAQNAKGQFSVKPMTGINLSTLGRSTFKDMFHMKTRWTAGFEVEYGLNDWMGLSLGLVYSQQGAKIDGCYYVYGTIDDPAYLYSLSYIQVEGKLHADYLNFPLMASIYIPAVKGLSIKAGLQFGALVNDDAEAKTTVAYTPVYNASATRADNNPMSINNPKVQQLYSIETRQTDVTKAVDFGIPIGLSYEYKNVILDARYYFGLTKTDSTTEPDNTRNRNLSITLGYRFHL